MDYDTAWSAYDESSLPTLWRNAQEYSPLHFTNSYAPANEISSHPSFHHHNSPESSSSFVNHQQTSTIPREVSGNNRYNSVFHPYYPSLKHTALVGHTICHSCCSASSQHFGTIGNCRSTYQKQMKMHSQACTIKAGKKDISKNKGKYNLLRNKSVRNILPEQQSSSQMVINQAHYETSCQNYAIPVPNLASSDQIPVGGTETTGSENPQISNNSVYKRPLIPSLSNSCKFQIPVNLSQCGEASATIDSNLNTENETNTCRQIQNVITSTNDDINLNRCSIANAIPPINTGVDINNLPLDGQACLSEELPTNEILNTNCKIEIIDGGDGGTEQLMLETLCTGKDSTGQDIIIFVTSAETQQDTNLELSTTENTQIENNPQTMDEADAMENGNSSEMYPDVGMAISPDTQNLNNENAVFTSSFDDFAREEIVETSKAKKTKRKQKSDSHKKQTTAIQKESRNKKHVKENSAEENSKLRKEKLNDPKVSQSPRIQNRSLEKGTHLNNRHQRKTPFQWRSKRMFTHLQNKYFSEFIQNLQSKNKKTSEGAFQKMLKLVFYRIRGSIIHSLQDTHDEMIRIYNEERKHNTSSKRNYIMSAQPALYTAF